MKKKILNTTKTLAIMMALMFTLGGCSDLTNNPLKDKETGEDLSLVLLDLDFFDTKLVIKFEDFDTGDLLIGEDITAGIRGNHSDSFVNLFGEKNEVYTTSAGIIELYLDPAFNIEATPLELDIVAVGDPLWISTPTSFEVNETGEQTIIVQMINWDKSASLKSASVTNDVGIDVTIDPWSDTNSHILNLKSYGAYNLVESFYLDEETGPSINLMCMIYGINCGGNEPERTIHKCTATRLSGIDEELVSFWGFADHNSKYVELGSGSTLYSAIKRNNVEKCQGGTTIKITSADIDDSDKISSSSFKYSILFDDGTKKEGELSGTFADFANGKKTGSFYYPKDKPVTISLLENSQYEFEQTSQSLNSPCGEVTFIAKKKSGLVNYNFNMEYSCEGTPVGLTYSGTAILKNLSKPNIKSEIVTLSTGNFSLQLIPGDIYNFSVIIKNQPYSFTISTGDIDGMAGQNIEGNLIKSISKTGNDADGYNISMSIILSDEVCKEVQ